MIIMDLIDYDGNSMFLHFIRLYLLIFLQIFHMDDCIIECADSLDELQLNTTNNQSYTDLELGIFDIISLIED